MDESIQTQTRQSLRATVIARGAGQLVSLGVLAALYRLLLPADFGLVGMVLPVLLLLHVVVTQPFAAGLIQQPQLTSADRFWLFATNMLVALVASAGLAIASPLLSWWYAEAAVLPLGLALSGTLLLLAAGNLPLAQLERDLKLAHSGWLRTAAQAVGGACAVTTAWLGHGAWALVWGQFGELALLAGGGWCLVGWQAFRPRGPQQTAALAKFATHYTASSLLFHLSQNVDKFLVGTLAGPQALGLYGQAFSLAMKPVNVVGSALSAVMLPALARLKADPSRFADMLGVFYRLLGIVLFPAGIGLAIVAPDAMLILGGPRWGEAGLLLRILAVVIPAQAALNLTGSVYASTGRAANLLRAAAASTAVLLTGVSVGAVVGQFGNAAALGAAAGYAATLAVLVIPYLRMGFTTVGAPGETVWRACRAPLVAAGRMAVCVVVLHFLLVWLGGPSWLRLTLDIATGIGTYLIFAKRELRWGWKEIAGRREAGQISAKNGE